MLISPRLNFHRKSAVLKDSASNIKVVSVGCTLKWVQWSSNYLWNLRVFSHWMKYYTLSVTSNHLCSSEKNAHFAHCFLNDMVTFDKSLFRYLPVNTALCYQSAMWLLIYLFYYHNSVGKLLGNLNYAITPFQSKCKIGKSSFSSFELLSLASVFSKDLLKTSERAVISAKMLCEV